MKNRRNNIFWGLLLIVAALVLVVGKLGYLPNINVFSIVLTVFFVACIIKSIPRRHYWGIFIPLAFIGIIYDKQLGITSITPWTLLIAAALISIGLSFLFPNKHWGNCGYVQGVTDSENFESFYEDEDFVNCNSTFSGITKYINSTNFKQASVVSKCGGVKLYLDNAKMAEDSAVITFDVVCGGVELFVPRTWNIINNLSATLGGTEEKNRRDDITSSTLILQGNLTLGGVTITYV